MQRHYSNNPIQEALCEFHFEPGAAWDSTIPGRIYEVLKPDFPTTKPARGIQATIAAVEGSVQQQVVEVDRAHLWSQDERTVVQIGADYLCINRLRPYNSWSKLRLMIQQALDAYESIAVPRNIQRVTLRYINRIDVPGPNIALDEWYSFYVVGPAMSGQEPTPIGAFLVQVNILFENDRDLLHVQLGSTPQKSPAEPSCVLDIAYVLVSPHALTLGDVGAWLENAHDRITLAFEGSITDKLRALFNEGAGT